MSVLTRQRKLKQWTQEDVANKVEVSVRTIERWEKGESVPSPYFQSEIARHLDLPVTEFGWQQKERKPRKKRCTLVDPVIPSLPLSLVDREELLEQLQEGSHLVGLVGLPGSGKTTLLQMLATSIPSEGVLWASLGPEPQIFQHFQHWATLLGLGTLPPDLKGAQEALRSSIGTRRMLILLDDVWNQEDVAPFLAIGGQACRFVLTTRQPGLAHLLCEQVFRVPLLSDAEAFELLVAKLPRKLVLEHKAILQTLVERVGQLPGALTLIHQILRREAAMPPARRFLESVERLMSHPFESFGTIVEQEARLPPTARMALRILVQRFRTEPFTEAAAITALAPMAQASALDHLMDTGFLEWSEESYHFPALFVAYASQDLVEPQIDEQSQEMSQTSEKSPIAWPEWKRCGRTADPTPRHRSFSLSSNLPKERAPSWEAIAMAHAKALLFLPVAFWKTLGSAGQTHTHAFKSSACLALAECLNALDHVLIGPARLPQPLRRRGPPQHGSTKLQLVS